MAAADGVYKVYSGFESGTFYFWHTGRFRTDATTLLKLSSAGLEIGINGVGADFYLRGDTTGDYVFFDASEEVMEYEDITLRMNDDTNLQFGTDADFSVDYDASNTRLQITPAVANRPIWFGNGTLNPDIRIAGSDSTNNIFMDSSEDQLRFTGVTIEMQGAAKILLNDTGTFLHSSVDGKIIMSSDGVGADDISLLGSITLDDDITTGSGKGFASDFRMATNKKVEFRDGGIYIQSGTDAILDIVSDDVIYLNGNIQYKQASETLGANKTFVLTDAPVQFLDPGGAARTLFMPATATATRFKVTIVNTADGAEAFDVRTAAGTSICAIAQNETGTLRCNGVFWSRDVGKNT